MCVLFVLISSRCPDLDIQLAWAGLGETRACALWICFYTLTVFLNNIGKLRERMRYVSGQDAAPVCNDATGCLLDGAPDAAVVTADATATTTNAAPAAAGAAAAAPAAQGYTNQRFMAQYGFVPAGGNMADRVMLEVPDR
jgi:hypothetical protein